MSRAEDKTAILLGYLVLAFQDLEANLLFLLTGLFEKTDSELARVLACQLPYRKLLNILDALFRKKIRQRDILERFQKIVSECSRLEEKRNTYIHSHYHFMDIVGSDTRIHRTKERVRRYRGYDLLMEEYDSDELDKVLESAYAVMDQINELISDLEERGIASYF